VYKFQWVAEILAKVTTELIFAEDGM